MDGIQHKKYNSLFTGFDFPTRDPFHPIVITQPYREIKVKSLADDFYSNLIDWHKDNIYIAIEDSIYCHNFYTASTSLLKTFHSSLITSVKGFRDSLIVGTSGGSLYTLDLNQLKSTKYSYHRSRIGVLGFNNGDILTGSRDKRIKIIDSRTGKVADTIMHHTQEVCGLDVNKTKTYLATGGNDNRVFVYDYRKLDVPLKKCSQHKAAIKAISWSPLKQSVLVTGGGTADKTVKLWDISLREPLVKSVDYGSQICNIKWLQTNHLLSTHGYSKDDVRLCASTSFRFEKEYLGHKSRVIHFSVSPDEKYFVTGSSDCSIKVWEVRGEAVNELKIR